MLVIACRYLTGRVVAAGDAARDEFQYPPEPARLFMALTAAAYEGHAEDDEFKTLRELETLPPPRIEAPTVYPREVKTVFVPVNDRAPDPWARAKQPRYFPSAFIGDQPVRFVWPDVVLDGQQTDRLRRLLGRVVRLGHSSSLVQMWLEVSEQHQNLDDASAVSREINRYVPDEPGRLRMRVAGEGTLKALDAAYNKTAVEQHAEMTLAINQAKARKQRKEAKKIEAKRGETFPGGPPKSRRPVIRTVKGYRRVEPVADSRIQQTCFDPVIVPLSQIDGNVFHLLQTLDLTRTFRQCLMSHLGDEVPSWVSGHDPQGGPTASDHVAFVPLAHVGETIRRRQFDPTRRAGGLSEIPPADVRGTRVDGHLLGLGLVIPREIGQDDRSERLADFLIDVDGTPQAIKLYASGSDDNANFELMLALETRPRAPKALTPETWTRPSRVWATTTPIVLDRHPKADPRKDRAGWRQEIAETIAAACRHIGIEQPPVAIDVNRHGFLAGVPSSHRASKQRSGGFPLLSAIDGKKHRLQIHALIEFKSPVRGPMILGAGRFRGYGLCKPAGIRTTEFEPSDESQPHSEQTDMKERPR